MSAKDRVQDINFNQIKIKVNDTCMKDEKIATKYKPSNPEDITNKSYLYTKFAEVNEHISYVKNIQRI